MLDLICLEARSLSLPCPYGLTVLFILNNICTLGRASDSLEFALHRDICCQWFLPSFSNQTLLLGRSNFKFPKLIQVSVRDFVHRHMSFFFILYISCIVYSTSNMYIHEHAWNCLYKYTYKKHTKLKTGAKVNGLSWNGHISVLPQKWATIFTICMYNAHNVLYH
jgi:hypothetical protein